MSYTTEEANTLRARVQAALGGGGCWQRQFLTDIVTRIDKYGRSVRFSDKQISKFYKILSSPGADSEAHVRPVAARHRPRRSSRGAGGYPVRQARWWCRRIVRDVTVMAALFVGFLIYSAMDNGVIPNPGQLFAAAPKPYAVNRPVSFSADFTVTDGDTIRFDDEARGMRIVGFNALRRSSRGMPKSGSLACAPRLGSDSLSETAGSKCSALPSPASLGPKEQTPATTAAVVVACSPTAETWPTS